MDWPPGPLALSDTVGFVRDLPHDLVAAFRSTLSEARDADLLLHVVDAADELRDERIGQVDAVLAEIGAGDIPQILVFNKIDRLEDAAPHRDPPADATTGTGVYRRERIWLSAVSGAGLDLLRASLAARFSDRQIVGELLWRPTRVACGRACTAWARSAARRRTSTVGACSLEMPLATAERLADEAGGHLLQPLLLVAPVAPTYNPDNH